MRMTKNSLLRKLATTLMASLTTVALLLVLGNSGTLAWFPPIVVFSLVGICLLGGIIYPFIWQWQENKLQIDLTRRYELFQRIIRYTVAFNLAGFGWKKIFGLQFVVPGEIAGLPMNQQSGEWLTWYYFGYSHSFGIILAAIQITGAYFLLFRKTVLPAAIALFAFMLNLTLVNLFYQMNAGALLQSVVITTGLVFLILLDYRRLVDFFLKNTYPASSFLSTNSVAKYLLRLSAIILSLMFTLYLKYIFQNH
jgi:hypothetical protein